METSKYFYLHIWSILGFDSTVTKVLDSSIHPPLMGEIGLEIDFLPSDDLFQVWPIFIATEELVLKLKNEQKISNCIEFHQINKVRKGQNLMAIYPNIKIPDLYWHFEFNGTAGVDHFGLWERMHLVVSEEALELLRNNNVNHAECDLIEGKIEHYFQSEKKDFWKKS